MWFSGLFHFRIHPEIYSSHKKYPVSLKPATVAKHKRKGKMRTMERPRAPERERQRQRDRKSCRRLRVKDG